MKQECEEWSEKRAEVVTPENYSSEEAFQAIAESFGEPENVTELNPAFHRPGELWDIATGKVPGYYYPSVGQPNFTELENRIKALETGNLSHPEFFSCVSFPRGMAAINATLEALSLGRDGVFIHGDVMYPSTKDILKDQGNGRNMIGTLPGVSVNLKNPENLVAEIRNQGGKNNEVLGIILEPVANPTIAYTDTRVVAEIAHDYGIPVIVDNTFLTPYLMEPFRMGADIVVHSLTKYYSGEGDVLGGAVVLPNEFLSGLKNTRKHKGYTPSPYDCFRLSQRAGGIGDRMKVHAQNAAELAYALENTEGVRVNYSHLGDETRDGLPGGVLSFEFEGTEQEAFDRAMRLTEFLSANEGVVKHAVSLAEPQTLVIPWGGHVPLDQMAAFNLDPSLVRVACGREEDFKPVVEYMKKGIQESM